jgi:hypothetical protein
MLLNSHTAEAAILIQELNHCIIYHPTEVRLIIKTSGKFLNPVYT